MGNTIPNKVDGTVKFSTEYTQEEAAKRGKHPIVAKTVETTDIPTSDVFEDFEDRNNKAVTKSRLEAALKIDFNIAADEDLLGKVIGDLQEDYGVSAGRILATLKYVTDYTGFSGDPELQDGNYMAVHVGNAMGADRITIQFAGRDEITLDPDGLHVQRFPSAIGDVIVRAYDANDKVINAIRYDLSGIVLEEAEDGE